MKELSRSDSQYTDIENFKDFEYTNCIAYELAIRNSHVQELVNKVLKTVGDTSKYCDELYISYSLPMEELYSEYHFFEEANAIFEANHEVTKDQNFKERNDGLYIEKVIETEYFHNFVKINVHDCEVGYFEENRFYQKYSRPKMYNSLVRKEADVHVDFSLPEKDIVAYIKEIKKYYDTQLLKSPYDEIVSPIKETKEKDNIVLKNREKTADMLFVYDCKKLDYQTRKIQNSIYNYYAEKGIETKTMDYKTIKKYMNIADIYIKDRKYLELITGKNFNSLVELGKSLI